MDTKHFDDENSLLYATKKAYVGRSPMGQVISDSRAPISRASIMKDGLVARPFDEETMYVEDMVRITGESSRRKEGISW